MSGDESEDGRLREAFALSETLRGHGGECPSPERLWESAREELRTRDNEEVVRHLAACAACSAAWRVARDLVGGEDAGSATARRREGWKLWLPLAAAAMLIVAVGVALHGTGLGPTSPPAYRAEGGDWIRPAAESLRPMPRDRFVLRWTEGPAGTSYDVRVVSGGRQPLARGVRLAQPVFRVPATSLEGVPPRAKILWQVTAHLPDGRVSDSATFLSQLE